MQKAMIKQRAIGLRVFFNQTNFQQEDWHKWYRMPMLVSGTTLFIRFLCTFLAWLALWMGLERWNTLRIKLAQHSTWKSPCTEDEFDDSESESNDSDES